jgi:OOP family OmpA-OmpF porin
MRLLLSALCASLLLGRAASAQANQDFQLERFRLQDGTRDALSAATGDVLDAQAFRAQVAFHYQKTPLVFFRGDTRLGAVVDDRLAAQVGVAFGIREWLQVGLELPVVLLNQGDDLTAEGIARPRNFGLGSPWLSVRAKLVGQVRGGLLRSDMPFDVAFGLAAAFPLGTANVFAREAGFAFVPQLSMGRDFGGWRLGGEVSATLRTRTVALSQEGPLRDQVGSQLVVGAVASTTGPRLRFELGGRVLAPLAGGTTPPGAELLAGVRASLAPIELFALGGPGLGELPGIPSFRVLAGVAFPAFGDAVAGPRPTPMPETADDDGDGIPDALDSCPLRAEDRDGFQDTDGCPDPDNDGDDVLDVDDACPNQVGPVERKGCPSPDGDKDGVADDEDKCPTEPGPASRRGCPEKDTDQDGVMDDVDACPSEAGPKERAGCPVRDRDEDGVENDLDKCPDERGVPENGGCPPKKNELVVLTREKVEIKDRVYFATAKSQILPKSFGLLDQVADVLKNHDEIPNVTVEGHTDSQGTRASNLKLSQARAEAVRTYLIKKGVAALRLKAAGFGPDRPVEPNLTEAGRSKNRRVEFVLTGIDVTPEPPK